MLHFVGPHKSEDVPTVNGWEFGRRKQILTGSKVRQLDSVQAIVYRRTAENRGGINNNNKVPGQTVR